MQVAVAALIQMVEAVAEAILVLLELQTVVEAAAEILMQLLLPQVMAVQVE
jgi:hypothetical protein